MPTPDPRLGALLGRDLRADEPARVAIVGFPVDEGVRRNGGRPGAAGGPAAIRAALHRLTPDAADPDRFTALVARTRDLGDVGPGADPTDLEGAQARLAEVVAGQLAGGAVVVVLGGGHETAYGVAAAHVALGRPPRVLNWDAHADVREPKEGRAHSGSPFRQLLEHPAAGGARYTVAGLQPHSVAQAHLAYVRAHGAAHLRDAVDGPAAVDAIHAAAAPTMVSFDLDAVDRAHAPGVSAPATNGLAVATWLRAAERAGEDPAVRTVDVVELCPPLDLDGQTAALAALTVWRVLRGVARRG